LNLNNSPNITIFEFRMVDEKTKGKNLARKEIHDTSRTGGSTKQ
jgi:hypothetical protein